MRCNIDSCDFVSHLEVFIDACIDFAAVHKADTSNLAAKSDALNMARDELINFLIDDGDENG